MATTAIAGVVAAGRIPGWISPAALVTADPAVPVGGVLPLDVLTDPTAVKIDCYHDMGDVAIDVTPTTRARQRACQVVAEEIKTGETISVTITAVYDQQALSSAEVNKVRAALAEGAEVYFTRAYGWDSNLTPTVATVGNVIRGKVQNVTENEPTSPEEDLKFTATISGSARWRDVVFSGA